MYQVVNLNKKLFGLSYCKNKTAWYCLLKTLWELSLKCYSTFAQKVVLSFHQYLFWLVAYLIL